MASGADYDLTAREIEVLRVVAEGHANREVVEGLFIAVDTRKRDLTQILNKLDVRSRTAATAYAIRHRLGRFRRDDDAAGTVSIPLKWTGDELELHDEISPSGDVRPISSSREWGCSTYGQQLASTSIKANSGIPEIP